MIEPDHPRLSIVLSITSGLVKAKLEGLIASTKLRVAKRICSFCLGSTPSIDSTLRSICSATSR